MNHPCGAKFQKMGNPPRSKKKRTPKVHEQARSYSLTPTLSHARPSSFSLSRSKEPAAHFLQRDEKF
jgi:hypothetical protein